MVLGEQSETNRKKPGARGMGHKSLALIDAMVEIIEAAQPITGRGVGYKLFVDKLIPFMKTPGYAEVYRLLKEARERGMIPWGWIVDESRQLEKTASWDDPEEYTRTMINGTGVSTGTSSRCGSRSGPRKARCGAFCGPCSTNLASASGWSTASLPPPPSTTWPSMTTGAI